MPTGTSTSNSSDNRLSDGAIGGIVGGLSSLILVATAVTIYCCRKHNGQKKQGDIDLQLEKQDNKM
ncbi:hypothetical protein MAR_021112 [Mya arenaria]|uniref:Uncharacterized protein n=1 Tax=Mya arenaria TaxID=6604 RepID=A0ABY7E6X8_MYAAR|nr:hypothetical protein MAR_021112 [Mya arenaria]